MDHIIPQDFRDGYARGLEDGQRQQPGQAFSYADRRQLDAAIVILNGISHEESGNDTCHLITLTGYQVDLLLIAACEKQLIEIQRSKEGE